MIPLRLLSVAAGMLLLMQASAPEIAAQRPTPTPRIFVPQPFGAIPPPTPTPKRKFAKDDEEKPIARGWKIAGAIAAGLVTAGLFYFATRTWRSSNLFDREYLFPIEGEPAVRFGGEKSGGHMATVRFRPEKAPVTSSKTEDS
jgi:hypothetical protein